MKNVWIVEAKVKKILTGEKNGKTWASMNLATTFMKNNGFEATMYINAVAFGEAGADVVKKGLKVDDVAIFEGQLYSEKRKDKNKQIVNGPTGKPIYDFKMNVSTVETTGSQSANKPATQASVPAAGRPSF